MSKTEPEMGLFGPIETTSKKSDKSAFDKLSSRKSSPASVAKAGLIKSSEAHLVRLAFDSGSDQCFDYAASQEQINQIQIGHRVKVPLGRSNRLQVGFCVGLPKKTDIDYVKPITQIIDDAPLLDQNMIELANWISDYYCCPLGTTLSAMVPAAVKKQIGLKTVKYATLTETAKLYFEGSLDKIRISKTGQKILNIINSHQGPSITIPEILTLAECSQAPVKTLQKLNLIDIHQKQYLPEVDLPSSSQNRSSDINIILNPSQQRVIDQISPKLDDDQFNAFLLHGVTGSGKTEVYMHAIEKVIQLNKQALVLVPEIALTSQTAQRFVNRFKKVAVLHSGLSNVQRHQQWSLIAEGKVNVVVGARSAIFAPLKSLGLIVVDEEHEPSYKQDTKPRYHARDVAIKIAHLRKISIILGSATPSLESYHNSLTRDHFQLLELKERVLDLPLPKVNIVNMRDELSRVKGEPLIGQTLAKEMDRCLNQKRQIILMLNRRGYSSYIFCPSCKFSVTCPNCDVSLTCHKKNLSDTLNSDKPTWVMCHHCLHASMIPKQCPVCSKKLILIGPGTQKAQEELHEKFPNAKIQRMDSDALSSDEYQEVLENFAQGHTDILLGTQMIAKGLDFPNVDLVGVLNADMSLSIPDFRSSERTFQLITQVAGRCGRAVDSGKVIVQSFEPHDPSIQLACRHDYTTFANMELKGRERCQMPPYRRMARILLKDHKLQKLDDVSRQLAENIQQVLESKELTIQLRGPMPAQIARMENIHRYQILLFADSATEMQTILSIIRRQYFSRMNVQILVDVDPIYLM